MKFLTQNFHLSNNLSTRMIEFLDDLPDSLPGDDEVQSSIAQMVDEALAEKIRVKRQEILERKAEQRLKLIQATRLIKTTKLFEKKVSLLTKVPLTVINYQRARNSQRHRSCATVAAPFSRMSGSS